MTFTLKMKTSSSPTRLWPFLFYCLLPSPAAPAPAPAPGAAALGFAFTSEGWSHPSAGFSSPAAAASLRALAATGATTVWVVVTAYVDSNASLVVHGEAAPSPLRTAAPDELRPFLALATQLGLGVVLAPTLDLTWTLPALTPRHAWYSDGSTSRASIGAALAPGDDASWDAFFASWSAWLLPWAALADEAAAAGARRGGGAAPNCSAFAGLGAGVVGFSLGSELNSVWGQEARMRALAARVRAAFPGGCLTAAMTGASLAAVRWLDALDLIGVDAFWSLDAAVGPLPLGRAPAVADLVRGWAKAVEFLGAASATSGRPVLVTATGAQARPNCHLLPWGTGAPGQADGNDQGDDSAWPCAYDAQCQANLYESAFEALLPHSTSAGGWLTGVLFWRWNADPTAGGPSDNDFCPHGKPAEAAFRAAAGAPPGDGADAVVAAMQAAGAAFIAQGVAAARAAVPTGEGGRAPPFTGFRGFVFGGPDEWSSPYYRLDSPGAEQSLRNMASLGANSLELVVQWYFASVNDTASYPITDPSSPMRTSTDAELTSFIALARSLGVAVILSPMLDPDWTLPTQLGCRTVARRGRGGGDPGRAGCFWRGQIGYFFPDEPDSCAASPQWAAWHASYLNDFILPYARLAQAAGAAGFVVAHELDRPVTNCAAEWATLLAAVRGAFFGAVSVAQGSGIFQAAAPTQAWLRTLSWLGVECYLGSSAAAPPEPWRDAALADMQAGVAKSLQSFAAYSATSGLKIACTEGGWLAAPWASEAGWGQLFDFADASVHFLDVSGPAQALAYTALLSVIEAQPWYVGGWYWLWRADPTAGGTSDPSPTPWAKEASAAIASLWVNSSVVQNKTF